MSGLSCNVLIMAGGTGGHVFPALSVAEYLRAQGMTVSWLGTQRGVEAQLVPQAGFPIDYISIKGLRGKGWISWCLAPFKLCVALWQALWICRRRYPNIVLGMGGFVTGPGGVASWLLRRPLLIHEQNAKPGLTNRLLSKLATRIMEAFPGSFTSKLAAIHTGNPVRDNIIKLPAPKERFAQHQGTLRLLVVGGSLGAQILNQSVPAAIALLPLAQRPKVWHQTGAQKWDSGTQLYQQHNIDARVMPFIEDMAEAFNWADLVVCRAGALTVSEIATVGIGAIFIPYPYAVDDHQTYNAQYLVNAQAAKLIQQTELTPEYLAAVLTDLFAQGRAGLLEMAIRANTLAKPDATQKVAQLCYEVAAHG